MKTSVVLCTYNGEKYIKDQIYSILNQTQEVDEIIINDDGSTDKTNELIKSIAEKQKFIKYYINKKNIGFINNFAEGIKKTNGDLVFFSDQDDIWLPNKVERIVCEFKKNSNINVVFTNASILNSNIKNLWSNYNYDFNHKICSEILKRDFVTGATMCCKRNFLVKYLPIPNQIYHDRWFALAAALTGTLHPIDENLIKYRVHEDQKIGLKKSGYFKQKLNEKNVFLNQITIIDSLFSMTSIDDIPIGNKILFENKKLFYLNRLNLNGNILKRIFRCSNMIKSYILYSSGIPSYLKDIIFRR